MFPCSILPLPRVIYLRIKLSFPLMSFHSLLNSRDNVILACTQRSCIGSWEVLKILLCHSKTMSILRGSNIPPSFLQAFSFWQILKKNPGTQPLLTQTHKKNPLVTSMGIQPSVKQTFKHINQSTQLRGTSGVKHKNSHIKNILCFVILVQKQQQKNTKHKKTSPNQNQPTH